MTRKPRVALIEPCFYGIGFVDAAFEMGCDIISVVSDRDNPKTYGYDGKVKDLIVADIRNMESIVDAIEASPYMGNLDAIVPANDYVVHIGAMAAERLNLKHIPPSSVIKARLKDETRKALQASGLANARYATATNFEEARDAAERIGYPVVVKPTDGACSQNVSLVRTEDELRLACDVLESFDESYLGFRTRKVFLVEEYIDGDEFSVEVFLNGGKVAFASVTEKIKSKPPHFVEFAHVVPTSTMGDKSGELIDAAARYLKALGLEDGAAHVEMRQSPRGPIVMEINPRPAGDRISQRLLINAFGVDVFAATIDWHLGNPVRVEARKNAASAIAYLTAKRDGFVKSIGGLDTLSSIEGIVESSIKVKPGDPVKAPKSSDDRYGYVISIGKTPAEAKRIAHEAIDAIELEIC
jgi:biotin carboxylase